MRPKEGAKIELLREIGQFHGVFLFFFLFFSLFFFLISVFYLCFSPKRKCEPSSRGQKRFPFQERKTENRFVPDPFSRSLAPIQQYFPPKRAHFPLPLSKRVRTSNTLSKLPNAPFLLSTHLTCGKDEWDLCNCRQLPPPRYQVARQTFGNKRAEISLNNK